MTRETVYSLYWLHADGVNKVALCMMAEVDYPGDEVRWEGIAEHDKKKLRAAFLKLLAWHEKETKKWAA